MTAHNAQPDPTLPLSPDETNRRTLESYNLHVPEYIAGTRHDVSGATDAWIAAALEGLPGNAAIMEIGSAFGRDALHIHAMGYAVECTDASSAFVEHLNGIGLSARLFNALTDDLDAAYDLIIANAVLLHFNPGEFAHVLGRMAAALNPGGRFAFSLKRGNGEQWSSHKLNAPRYFCYWQPDALPEQLAAAGFERWSIAGESMDRTHADWLFVVAQK